MLNAIFFEGDIETNFIGHQAAEIYKEKIYAPFIEKKNLEVCIDIGAMGLTPYYFSKHFKTVYSLEPSSDSFKALTTMLEYNKITNVNPINKAIYIKSGKFPLGGPDNNQTMRSLHTATWQNGQPREEVEAITLPDLFKEKNINHVDFMKVDIEGTETELFSSSSFLEVAPKIDLIITESHSWSGRNPNQLKEALKNAGFRIETIKADATVLVAHRI